MHLCRSSRIYILAVPGLRQSNWQYFAGENVPKPLFILVSFVMRLDTARKRVFSNSAHVGDVPRRSKLGGSLYQKGLLRVPCLVFEIFHGPLLILSLFSALSSGAHRKSQLQAVLAQSLWDKKVPTGDVTRGYDIKC